MFSFQKKSSAYRSLLQDWDLWGPMLVCVVLGSLLHDDNASNLFTLVFAVVGFGSLVVTCNTKLLGGTVSLLQSMCVLGYCLGPIAIALPTVKVISYLFTGVGKLNFFIKLVVTAVALAWSCYAALQFMISSIQDSRRLLAIYPICLFYTVISWMILTQ